MARFSSTDIPIPEDWPKGAKIGFLCAVSLAHRALTVIHSWCVNSPIARVRLVADADRAHTEIALLREELRIKDARTSRVAPAHRPHYPPPDRLAILALKASRGWNNAQTARAFHLTPATIANWLSRLNTDGPDALVAFPKPANRFPEYVSLLVQELKIVCPTMGKVRIAQALARAGLHLSPASVKRMLKRNAKPRPPTSPNANAAAQATRPGATEAGATATANVPQKPRVVTARSPHHVWHADLTAIPTAMGFWIPWFPKAMGQIWPFCYWALAIVDHFTRQAVLVKSSLRPPSAETVTASLDEAIAVIGHAPKYLVTDQGPQFRESYRDWCASRTIKPRFGAIGQHGSIALCERFIRTLKDECTRRIVVPLAPAAFQQELILFAIWYNQRRPHRSLHGRAPNEVHDSGKGARDGPKFETRTAMIPNAGRRDGDGNRVVPVDANRLRLVVTPFEGRTHLPIVTLERAA